MIATRGAFSYGEFTVRNRGFVSETEQRRLREARVFVCGAGGMGGAAIQSLVRAGVGHLAVADPDRFELSNLNRQVFANLRTVGERKTEAVRRAVRDINPELDLVTYGAEWQRQLPALLRRYPVVINAMDDIRAGIALYRAAREYGAAVIDAYTAPLPSVTVVRPEAPRPEERLGFPSPGRDPSELTDREVLGCLCCELEYVLLHSSSARHVDRASVREFLSGRRGRPSFAPMVVTTGNLMCFEALKLFLRWSRATDERGYFLNPWSGRIERPRGPLTALIRRRFVERALGDLGV